jgi:hypothetical protein
MLFCPQYSLLLLMCCTLSRIRLKHHGSDAIFTNVSFRFKIKCEDKWTSATPDGWHYGIGSGHPDLFTEYAHERKGPICGQWTLAKHSVLRKAQNICLNRKSMVRWNKYAERIRCCLQCWTQFRANINRLMGWTGSQKHWSHHLTLAVSAEIKPPNELEGKMNMDQSTGTARKNKRWNGLQYRNIVLI